MRHNVTKHTKHRDGTISYTCPCGLSVRRIEVHQAPTVNIGLDATAYICPTCEAQKMGQHAATAIEGRRNQ